MSDHQQSWATVGKILALLTAVLGIPVATHEVWQLMTGPSVVAVVEYHQNVPSPEARDKYLSSYSKAELAGIVERKDGLPRSTPLGMIELMGVPTSPRF